MARWSQAVNEPEAVAVLRRALGRQLAARRTAAGYNQTAFAPLTGYARSTVANVEVGRQNVPRDFWQRCDAALGTDSPLTARYDELQAVIQQRRDAVASAARAERQARVRQWQTAAPSLSSDETEQEDDVKRRALLANGLAALGVPALKLGDLRRIAAALDDAHRYFDGSVTDYFRRQLVACAGDDGTHGPKATLPTVLGIVGAVEHAVRQVKPSVRRELLAVGAHAAEFAGWLYRDSGSPELADYWRDRAMEWAQAAGDHPLQGYVLLKKSQTAWDQRDAVRMLTLAQAAQDTVWQLPARVRAEAAQQTARGHAMLGDSFALVERQLDAAQHLLTDESTPDGEDLSSHYRTALFAVQTAICYHEAGRPNRAVTIYGEHLTKANFSRRDYGYFVSLQATALAATKEPDEAATVGRVAYDIGTATNSARTLHEVHRLVRQLDTWATRPAVLDLREAVVAPSAANRQRP